LLKVPIDLTSIPSKVKQGDASSCGSSAQFPKQPTEKAEDSVENKRDEESLRCAQSGHKHSAIFSWQFFPEIMAAMYGTDRIDAAAHWLPLFRVAGNRRPIRKTLGSSPKSALRAVVPRATFCLSGADEPDALSREALSLSALDKVVNLGVRSG
jgi:hypothetical protein